MRTFDPDGNLFDQIYHLLDCAPNPYSSEDTLLLFEALRGVSADHLGLDLDDPQHLDWWLQIQDMIA